MKIRYFDNAATTKINKDVLQEMVPYLSEEYGNPSSLYSVGRSAKRAIEKARCQVANLIKCNKNEIYFTAGGSESDNTAIKGIARLNRNNGKHIITSKIEHPAVLNSCESLEKEGFLVTYLNVDKEGFINLDELMNSIRNDTILISIMLANNEIGTIEPICEICKIAKQYNIKCHIDAVQGCGNIPIDVKKIGIDLLALSGHKINGPKGIGALYVRDGIDFEKLIDGGHQESNKRSGTENVSGIVGLGKACEIANNHMNNHIEYLTNLRDYYICEIEKKIKDVKLNGPRNKRLPGNANFSFKGIEGDALLLKLDEKGICVSTGSACSSGAQKPSHVLSAIGLSNDLAQGSIRTTFSEENTKEDVDFLVENITKCVAELRRQNC